LKILTAIIAIALAAVTPALRQFRFERQMAVKVKAHNTARFTVQDTKGSFFLIGSTADSNLDQDSADWLVAKFSPTGAKLWTRTFNGKGNAFDQANAAAIDKLGNIYVVGYTTGLEQEGSSGAVVKWDTNGNRKWVRYSPGNANLQFEQDEYLGVAVDYTGQIYVCGSKTVSPVQGIDMLVEKIGPAGTVTWSKTWDGMQGGEYERARFIKLHRNGTIYLAGEMPRPGVGNSGYLNLTNNGTIQSSHRYQAEGNGYTTIVNIDVVGNKFYIFGGFSGTMLTANEASVFTEVRNAVGGGLIAKRLVLGNAVKRYAQAGSAAPDGSFVNFFSAYTGAGDGIAQGAHYSQTGVLSGLFTLDPPQNASAFTVDAFGPGQGSLVYRSNSTYQVPLLNGIPKTADAIVLNLPTQQVDAPVIVSDGRLVAPFHDSANGAAGLRVFRATTYAFAATKTLAPGATSLDVTIYKHPDAASQTLEVTFYANGTYVFGKTINLNTGKPSEVVSGAFPALAPGTVLNVHVKDANQKIHGTMLEILSWL